METENGTTSWVGKLGENAEMIFKLNLKYGFDWKNIWKIVYTKWKQQHVNSFIHSLSQEIVTEYLP